MLVFNWNVFYFEIIVCININSFDKSIIFYYVKNIEKYILMLYIFKSVEL